MWERILIAVALRLTEKIFKRIEKEQDEKKRLKRQEKVVAGIAGLQKRYTA